MQVRRATQIKGIKKKVRSEVHEIRQERKQLNLNLKMSKIVVIGNLFHKLVVLRKNMSERTFCLTNGRRREWG